MSEKQWAGKVRHAMDLRRSGKRAEAVEFLKKEIRLLRKNPDTWNVWREGEALALIAMLYEEQRNFQLAASYYQKGGVIHRGEMRGHSIAASERLARAALLYFKSGKKTKGTNVAKEAFELARLHSDPSPVYEELLQEVRKYQF